MVTIDGKQLINKTIREMIFKMCMIKCLNGTQSIRVKSLFPFILGLCNLRHIFKLDDDLLSYLSLGLDCCFGCDIIIRERR